jgi:hypothetical protein
VGVPNARRRWPLPNQDRLLLWEARLLCLRRVLAVLRFVLRRDRLLLWEARLLRLRRVLAVLWFVLRRGRLLELDFRFFNPLDLRTGIGSLHHCCRARNTQTNEHS